MTEKLLDIYPTKVKKLQAIIAWLPTNQREQLCTALLKEREKNCEEPKKNQEIKLNYILNNLKRNHVRCEENIELYGKKWKIIHLELPSVWKFEWYKFNCFVTKDSVDLNSIKSSSKIKNKMYTIDEIWEFMTKFNQYLNECWIYTDGDIDYTDIFSFSCGKKSKVWKYIERISWISDRYLFRNDWKWWLDWTFDFSLRGFFLPVSTNDCKWIHLLLKV